MSGTGRTDRGRRLGGVLSGLAVAVGCVLFLGGFVWGALLYQPYTVPTDSMSPTVAPGDRVLAQRIDGSEVRRGDVVVFTDRVWGDAPMVKRVVGTGGDEIACCGTDGRLTVNGRAVEEPYLRGDGPASPIGFTVSVPEGKLFLLGDERRNSVDSRSHLQEAGRGTVPAGSVSARLDAVAWPPGGFLERPRSFAALPGGVSEPGPIRPVLVSVLLGAVLILGGAAWGPLAGLAARRRATGRSGAAADA
ncbi:signal peptidase I [Streptomyces spongiicola]|uniref:Signal peptidase I n=1 Tax=Streptomyces spongiicola TaxID=1690221 RepID=A0ABN5KMN1_9ACTN|nr:signal peptidase I [Streptomyces spongiicola]AWK11414.1 signal peptidase I [Streptomyces spongiicola]